MKILIYPVTTMTKGIAVQQLVMHHRVGLEQWEMGLIRKLQMVMDIQRVKVRTTSIKTNKHEKKNAAREDEMDCIGIESNESRYTVS